MRWWSNKIDEFVSRYEDGNCCFGIESMEMDEREDEDEDSG